METRFIIAYGLIGLLALVLVVAVVVIVRKRRAHDRFMRGHY